MVRSPSDAGLGALMRALLPASPAAELVVQPHGLAELPAGVHVLRPEPDASGWSGALLDALKEREQRLVLWLVPDIEETLDSEDSAA
ncbi:MAG: hypothetical protein KJ558_17185, partial [Gammaproteobacteria bacterium]|nr:hypothetical protein [Gammaproteobacteria bacterium]